MKLSFSMKLVGFLLVGSAAAFAPVVPFNTNNRLVRSSSMTVSVDDFKVQHLYSVAVTAAADAKADSKYNSNKLIYPPLLITNLITKSVPGSEEGEVTFAHEDKESGSEEAKFLYDIQMRDNTYHAKITDDIKKVQDILKDQKDNILLYMHGFTANANDALQYCTEYNSRANPTYLAVPIVWNTHDKLWMYEVDRRNCATDVAPALTKLLEQMLKDKKNWQHKYSIMCHSMGNHILRMVSQLRGVNAQGDVVPRKEVFENIFMVAADVREDIFDEKLNDFNKTLYPTLERVRVPHLHGKPWEMETRRNDEGLREGLLELIAGAMKIEKRNPGLDIASLAKNKVHVLWRRNDFALLASALEKLLLFRGVKYLMLNLNEDEDGKKIPIGALGRHGSCYGERIKIHDKLKNKVVFHNCHDFSNEHDRNRHSYQWNEEAIEIYEGAIEA